MAKILNFVHHLAQWGPGPRLERCNPIAMQIINEEKLKNILVQI